MHWLSFDLRCESGTYLIYTLDIHMDKFADISYNFAHGKNDSWNRHVSYISIEKLLKIKLIAVYRLV